MKKKEAVVDTSILKTRDLMHEILKKQLIRGLEIRKRQLCEGSAYPLHNGHHLRDVMTVLAFLEGNPASAMLMGSMPEEKDLACTR